MLFIYSRGFYAEDLSEDTAPLAARDPATERCADTSGRSRVLELLLLVHKPIRLREYLLIRFSLSSFQQAAPYAH